MEPCNYVVRNSSTTTIASGFWSCRSAKSMERGMKLFISGNPQSTSALRIWNSLAREGKVKKNRDWGYVC